MRKFLILSTLAASLTYPVFADEKADIEAFKKAYAAYNEALKKPNNALLYNSAKTAYELGSKVFGDQHKNTANLAFNYAKAANDIGNKKEEAQKALEVTEKIYLDVYGKDAPEFIDLYLEKASSAISLFQNRSTGRHYYKKALDLTRKHFEENSLNEGIILKEIGNILLYQARTKDALKHLRKAKTILELHGNQGLVQLAHTNMSLGKFYLADRKYKKATKAFNASLDVYTKHAPSAPITLSNHAFLIQSYEKQGLSDKATYHCRAIGEANPKEPDQDYLPIYRANPSYPRTAANAGSEGYVILELTVDENGFVKNPKVFDSTGSKSFHKASLDAAKKFRYAPRFENGQAVATEGVKYHFSFELAN